MHLGNDSWFKMPRVSRGARNSPSAFIPHCALEMGSLSPMTDFLRLRPINAEMHGRYSSNGANPADWKAAQTTRGSFPCCDASNIRTTSKLSSQRKDGQTNVNGALNCSIAKWVFQGIGRFQNSVREKNRQVEEERSKRVGFRVLQQISGFLQSVSQKRW
jgi:hypothetical protein